MMTEEKINYYEIFDLSPASTKEQIIARYQDLKKLYGSAEVTHPESFSSEDQRALMELLDEAYAILGNPTLRRIYNEKYNLNSLSEPMALDLSVSPVAGRMLPKTEAQVQTKNQVQNQAQYQVQNQAQSQVQNQNQVRAGNQKLTNHDSSHFSAKVDAPLVFKLDYIKDPDLEQVYENASTAWDGPLLKQVREYKNVTIERLSQFTKINPFYILAVEKMEPSELPAPVFVRGYIVQIARALGLNEDVVASQYMKTFQRVCGRSKNSSL